MFLTNVNGLINMTQAILPIFKKRSDGGRGDIINIGSIAGRETYPGGSIYCATKAAVRSFTEALRKELIATRIRVIEIDPGQVETVRAPGAYLLQKLTDSLRNSPLSGSMVTSPRRMPSMRTFPSPSHHCRHLTFAGTVIPSREVTSLRSLCLRLDGLKMS